MGEYDDRGAGGASLEIRSDPVQLLRTEAPQSSGLEIQNVDQRDEVHAGVIKAVITPVLRGLAEPREVFAAGRIGNVMLPGGGVQFRGSQLREQLLGEIKFRSLGQVGDVARVDDQRRLPGQTVHKVNRAAERAADIRIGVFRETDVGIAELDEQRCSDAGESVLAVCRDRQVKRRENAARQCKQCSGSAVSHAT